MDGFVAFVLVKLDFKGVSSDSNYGGYLLNSDKIRLCRMMLLASVFVSTIQIRNGHQAGFSTGISSISVMLGNVNFKH